MVSNGTTTVVKIIFLAYLSQFQPLFLSHQGYYILGNALPWDQEQVSTELVKIETFKTY